MPRHAESSYSLFSHRTQTSYCGTIRTFSINTSPCFSQMTLRLDILCLFLKLSSFRLGNRPPPLVDGPLCSLLVTHVGLVAARVYLEESNIPTAYLK